MSDQADRAAPQQEWLDRLAGAGNYNGWIFRACRPYLHGRVLEVGCGTGTFTGLIAGTAESLTAVEIDASFIAQAEERLGSLGNVRFHHGDAIGDLPEGTYDAVVLLDVLEHIEDDAAMLRSLASRLAPGGNIVLKVPALPGLYNSLDRSVGHHRRYGRGALNRLARNTGLGVVRIFGFNVAGIPGWWWNGIRGRDVAPAMQIDGFDRVVPLFEWVERLVPPPFGLSYVAVLGKQA